MNPDVIKVKVLADYCLIAEFETGEQRWFDMKPFWSSLHFQHSKAMDYS